MPLFCNIVEYKDGQEEATGLYTSLEQKIYAHEDETCAVNANDKVGIKVNKGDLTPNGKSIIEHFNNIKDNKIMIMENSSINKYLMPTVAGITGLTVGVAITTLLCKKSCNKEADSKE